MSPILKYIKRKTTYRDKWPAYSGMKHGRQNKQSLFPVSSRYSPRKGTALDIKMDSEKKLSNRKLICQLFSAFCSSACENFAAVFSSHSLSETMLFLSLELLWLICSYHFFLTSLQGETLQSKIIDKNLKKVNRISHDYAFYFLYYIRKLFKIPFLLYK